MNKNTIEGNWKQLKGKVQEKWGKLTNDDMDRINGNTTQLEGKIQERYGITQEKAKEAIEEFNKSC